MGMSNVLQPTTLTSLYNKMVASKAAQSGFRSLWKVSWILAELSVQDWNARLTSALALHHRPGTSLVRQHSVISNRALRVVADWIGAPDCTLLSCYPDLYVLACPPPP